MKVASRGFLGVDCFFAISGFLICGMLLREFAFTGDIDLRRFYTRRFFRILPPYYVALAATCLLGVLGILRQNYTDLPSCLLFYRNFMPLGMDLHGGYYTAHFWSLAVEEQFYLIWPVLLLALKPKQAGKVALIVTTLSLHLESFGGPLSTVGQRHAPFCNHAGANRCPAVGDAWLPSTCRRSAGTLSECVFPSCGCLFR